MPRESAASPARSKRICVRAHLSRSANSSARRHPSSILQTVTENAVQSVSFRLSCSVTVCSLLGVGTVFITSYLSKDAACGRIGPIQTMHLTSYSLDTIYRYDLESSVPPLLRARGGCSVRSRAYRVDRGDQVA